MKKVIKYRYLFTNLEKDFGFVDSVKFINRIRKFSPKLLDALYMYQEKGTVPEIEVKGVFLNELIEKEQMSPIGALIMLDWIEKKPEDAFDYMYKYRHSVSLPELNDVQRAILSERVKELREESLIPKPEIEPIIEKDIVFNTVRNHFLTPTIKPVGSSDDNASPIDNP